MRYPIWFPSHHAWLKASRLFIPAYGLATVVFAFFFWVLMMLAVILVGSALFNPSVAVTEWKGLLLFVASPLLPLVMGFLWYLLVGFIWFLFLKLLWSSPPKTLRPSTKWSEIVLNFTVLIVAVLPNFLIFTYQIGVNTYAEIHTGIEDFKIFREPFENAIIKLWWIWPITAAYCYHWIHYANKNSLSNSQKARPRNIPKP